MAQRECTQIAFSFAAGATVSTVSGGGAYANTGGFCFGGFSCSDEFNGDTITFKTLTPLGAITKMTKVAATGWNYFTADELVQIGSADNLSMTTGSATAAAATIYLELKS